MKVGHWEFIKETHADISLNIEGLGKTMADDFESAFLVRRANKRLITLPFYKTLILCICNSNRRIITGQLSR